MWYLMWCSSELKKWSKEAYPNNGVMIDVLKTKLTDLKARNTDLDMEKEEQIQSQSDDLWW